MQNVQHIAKKPTETFYTQLINNLLTGVLVVDENFVICDTNATIEQILSTSANQIKASDIFVLLSDKHLPAAELADYQAQLKAQFIHAASLYQAFIRHDCTIMGINTPVLVDYGVSPIEFSGKNFYIVEIWTKDRQSQIQQEQQQYAQHHMTRQLIRSMAHEVKNPLAGIYGASQLLQKNISQFIEANHASLTQKGKNQIPKIDPNKLQKVQTYLDIVMEETRRLNELVNQLLGSPTLPHWQSINIHEPIEHVIALVTLQDKQQSMQQNPLSPSQPIEFVRDYDLSLPEIVADKNQLIQVFLNLINNAMQVLNEHPVTSPTITLRTRIEYQFTIGDTRHKSVLRIDVMDNGVGIDPKFIGQIFYPLVTGRASGTGLGLALVHDIIQRHHGMITVQSPQANTQLTTTQIRSSQGLCQGKTVFSLYLPWTQTNR